MATPSQHASGIPQQPQPATPTPTLENEIGRKNPPFSDEAKTEAAETIEKFTEDLVALARQHAGNHERVLRHDVQAILAKLGRGRGGPNRGFLSQTSNIVAGLGAGGLFTLVTTAETISLLPTVAAIGLIVLGGIGMWFTKT